MPGPEQICKDMHAQELESVDLFHHPPIDEDINHRSSAFAVWSTISSLVLQITSVFLGGNHSIQKIPTRLRGEHPHWRERALEVTIEAGSQQLLLAIAPI